jgi:6-phosphofructokinase
MEVGVQRLAVLTSGGDAPGVNAAMRAMVRSAVARGFETVGVQDGYKGLVNGDFRFIGRREVGGIIQMCGTKLGTTRYEPLKTAQDSSRRIRADRVVVHAEWAAGQ